MKKLFIFVASVAILASCANDEIINNGDKLERNVPITLSTNRQNITRATSLESNHIYNFGTWAYKLSGSTKPASLVMENYLVGYTDQVSKGYYLNGATTWGGGDTQNDHSDHLSPWFYENLGKVQYTYADETSGLYTKNDTKYMSANDYQYLRYWDLAYSNTNFYCYSPYQASGVTLAVTSLSDANNGKAVMTFAGTALRDGYDHPVNSDYKATSEHPAYDRSLSEFMYAGVQATNSQLQDVNVPFKHMGAQLFIRFIEEIPGYKVELIDLAADGAKMKDGTTDDQKTGVQATPSKKTAGTGGASDTYALGQYNTTSGATVTYTATAEPTLASVFDGSTTVNTNLMFHIPSATAADYPTGNLPANFGANFTTFDSHNCIVEAVGTGTQSSWSWSPTIYYPVAQPTDTKTGFTFHVSYRIIAEDNKEVITVHNATVHVPVANTVWTAGKRYIYTFRITKNSTGSTNPTPTDGYDPASPTPDVKKSLYPIVFDECTIEDYSVNESEHTISNGTGY